MNYIRITYKLGKSGITNTHKRENTMTARISSAEWRGMLKEGKGIMQLGSGAYQGPFSFASRFESGEGTNPKELVGAAHTGCFSTFLSALLTKAGFTPSHTQGSRSGL
jgi:lipoyl-dependent peroxiredoxin